MSGQGPALPGSDDFARLDVEVGRELHAGKQSRVFAGRIDGWAVVVKLTDERLADQARLVERMLTAEELARNTEAAIAPVRIDGELVHTVGEWLVTVTPFVVGRKPDISIAGDARLLGRTLGELHGSLGKLSARSLGPVAALEFDHGGDRSEWQLLHGDFSDQNVIVSSLGPRVLDFDDCGYGPVLYDVANSLYMVLFDAEVNADAFRYSVFRPAFLDGYADAAGASVDVAIVDSLIATRIDALGRWLDDLTSAPIGIRSSSPEWRETLRAFVSAHHTPGAANGTGTG